MKANSQKGQHSVRSRKLKLNKETIKDLNPDARGAEKVKGGAGRANSDNLKTCPTICEKC